jgi:hypothetical protein
MIYTLLTVIGVLGVMAAAGVFGWRQWLKPTLTMKWYKHTLEVLGYKVVALPFQPFKIPMASIHKHHEQDSKDAFW